MLSSFRPVCGARCARRGVSVASTRPLCVALAAALPLRRLGDSELMVPSICLGTMTWGQQNTEAEAHEQLNYAFDERGINFIDTAEMYPVPTKATTQGRTDKYIASWLKNRKREDVTLATKVAGRSDRITWLREGGAGCRVDADNIKQSIDKSLQRLGTDYVDLLQVHWPDRHVSLFGGSAYNEGDDKKDDTPIREQLEALDALVKAGKVRAIGVSNETSFGVTEWVRAAREMNLTKICSIQNSYSLIVRTAFETDLAETCAKRNTNVGLLAYSPLAGGALSGKYNSAPAAELANARFNLFTGFMERFNKSLAREAVAAYVKLAKSAGMSPTTLALAFVHSRWFVASSIIGATSVKQLKENCDAFDVVLSEDVQKEIAAIYKRFRDPATG